MKRYVITYTSTMDGDCCHVWTEASSKNEAIRNVKNEYWDIAEIISVE